MDEIFQTINYFFKFVSPQLLLKNDGYVMTMKINIEYNKSFEIIKLKKKKDIRTNLYCLKNIIFILNET